MFTASPGDSNVRSLRLIAISHYFSVFCVHINHLGMLLKSASDSVGLECSPRMCISNSTGEADVAGVGTSF